jgi:hypothetical protein
LQAAAHAGSGIDGVPPVAVLRVRSRKVTSGR